jgi:hypothetical protein
VITDHELSSLQIYLHQLAVDWWNDQPESRSVATCDSCSNRPIERHNGYLIGSYLWCSDCFQGKAVAWIRKDGADRMLGVGVLAKALEMTRSISPQKGPSQGVSIPIFIDETDFKINGSDIPLAPQKDDLHNCLGTPSREFTGSGNTIYTFDDLGITYHVSQNSSNVGEITFYLSVKDYKFMPNELYQGPLVVKGINFPLAETIDRICSMYPEITKGDFGGYNLSLGPRKMSFAVDYQSNLIQSFYIVDHQ